MTNKKDEIEIEEAGDNVFEDVAGGANRKDEYTIKPGDGSKWDCYNPNFVNGGVALNNIEINGKVDDRDDESK